jgi:hypothetical protein
LRQNPTYNIERSNPDDTMADRVEVVDGDHLAPSVADKEKSLPRVTPDNFGDQISHEMLEELAPNGDGEYILDKINSMSEEDALQIIEESIKFHADDWNFPTEMRDRMTRLLEGPKQYGEFYDRDIRIDAVLMRYSSPYPGVRAVAENRDDVHVPVETIRAYFLGIGWAIIGTFMATFFNSRFPSISKSRPDHVPRPRDSLAIQTN